MSVIARSVIISLAVSAPAYSAECLKDGAVVSLTGQVSRETFPGPPNYKSIDEGDKPETVWILTTQSPRCVVAESMESGKPYEVAKAATRFQLAIEKPSDYAKNKSLVEQRATVSGQLFVGISGHHHTKVLVSVKSISPAK